MGTGSPPLRSGVASAVLLSLQQPQLRAPAMSDDELAAAALEFCRKQGSRVTGVHHDGICCSGRSDSLQLASLPEPGAIWNAAESSTCATSGLS